MLGFGPWNIDLLWGAFRHVTMDLAFLAGMGFGVERCEISPLEDMQKLGQEADP